MSELEGESFRLALPCLGKTSAILESGISSTVMPLFCFENNTAHASQRCATRAVSIRYLRAVCSRGCLRGALFDQGVPWAVLGVPYEALAQLS
nr:MAG TPA: hypothetical protein [Caudoviricetes sp.]